MPVYEFIHRLIEVISSKLTLLLKIGHCPLNIFAWRCQYVFSRRQHSAILWFLNRLTGVLTKEQSIFFGCIVFKRIHVPFITFGNVENDVFEVAEWLHGHIVYKWNRNCDIDHRDCISICYDHLSQKVYYT